jgi:hypothetical protein
MKHTAYMRVSSQLVADGWFRLPEGVTLLGMKPCGKDFLYLVSHPDLPATEDDEDSPVVTGVFENGLPGNPPFLRWWEIVK